jgi:hypothetical protein
MSDLKAKATIGKPALRAIAFFTTMRPGVNLAAFDTVVNHFGALGLEQMLIPPIIVKPQPEQQHKAARQIQEKKEIHIESNHRL